MPLYDFECSNHGKKPYDFERSVALNDKVKPKCPKCNKSGKVKKVIKTAVPVSQSWKV